MPREGATRKGNSTGVLFLAKADSKLVLLAGVRVEHKRNGANLWVRVPHVCGKLKVYTQQQKNTLAGVLLVPREGLEPSWDCSRQILSLLRLPISPSRLKFDLDTYLV